MHETTRKALAAQKLQSGRETRKKLELAVRRLLDDNPIVVRKGTKLSAASVAREAGVDRATLYRFHEPVLVEIRKINDSFPKALLKEKRSDLTKAADKVREYRRMAEEAQKEVELLAGVNYRLDAQVKELKDLIRVRDEVISGLQKQLNERGSKLITFPSGSNG
jgi:DNA-binding XRE family transcriptional regulator